MTYARTLGSTMPGYGRFSIAHHGPDQAHSQDWWEVEEADPVIMISDNWIAELCEGETPCARMEGDLLKITAENGGVIYRIMERVGTGRVLRWPD